MTTHQQPFVCSLPCCYAQGPYQWKKPQGAGWIRRTKEKRRSTHTHTLDEEHIEGDGLESGDPNPPKTTKRTDTPARAKAKGKDRHTRTQEAEKEKKE